MISSKRTIKSIMPLFFSISLMFVGNGLVISSCSAMLKAMNVGELAIGAVNACFYIGAMISTIAAHRVVSRTGHIRAFGIFSALFAISAMLHVLSQNLLFWSFLRVMLGFCYYGLLLVSESWINERARNEIRSRVLAFYECVFYMSFAMGVMIFALELDNTQIFIISAAFIMISSLPLNLIRIKVPKMPPREPVSIPKIFSIVPLALVCSIVAGVLMSGFMSMSGLYIMLKGYGAREVSFFMTAGIVGGFFSQMFLGSFSDKFGRRLSIMIACAVSLFASIGLLFVSEISALYALCFLLGSGIFCLYALALARANDVLSERGESLKVGRALLFSYSLGSLISAGVLGVMMKILGANGFIYVYIVLLVFLFVFSAAQHTVAAPYRRAYEPSSMRTDGIEREI